MVFFAIWWAWMNFTWFASAYDCDDVPYRLAVFVQIAGALILAAGVPGDVREPHSQLGHRRRLRRDAAGGRRAVAAGGGLRSRPPNDRASIRRWASRVLQIRVGHACSSCPVCGFRAFSLFAVLELAVPVWAERAAPTTWHPHHIAERYGLLTLIVLGESILAATVGDPDRAGRRAKRSPRSLPLIVGGLLIVYSMWWIYFDRPVHDLLDQPAQGDRLGLRTLRGLRGRGRRGRRAGRRRRSGRRITRRSAPSAPALPWRFRSCVYLLCLWFLHDRPAYRQTRLLGPDRRGPGVADAVHRPRRAADRRNSGGDWSP